jgi:hypothetical protein
MARWKALYEYELEEHIDYWYEGLKSDREQFVFAINGKHQVTWQWY